MKTITTMGFRRGEVYYVRYDSGMGTEMGVGRPYLIVSCDEQNIKSSLLTVVPLTTATKYDTDIFVELTTPSRRSWAVLNNIASFDKMRFGDKMCTLTPHEMANIDEALAGILELPINTARKRAEADRQIEALKQAVIDAEKAAADAEIEKEIFEKAYERILDKLVDQRIEKDVAARIAPVEETEPKQEPVVIPEPEPVNISEPKIVDINRCAFDDLKALNFTDNVILNIIANRPYMSIEDLRIIPGVTRVAYGLIEKKITVGDTAEFKLNKPKPVKKQFGEWDRPITWEVFKSYPHEKQVKCLTHFKEKHRASSGMLAEMFGLKPQSLSQYWGKHDLKGLLVHNPNAEDVKRFMEWLSGVGN